MARVLAPSSVESASEQMRLRAEGKRQTAAVSLSSLSSTVDRLKNDERRNVELVQQLSRKSALHRTQTQHTQRKTFAESAYVFVKTIGQGRFGLVKSAKKKSIPNSHIKFTSRQVSGDKRSKMEDCAAFVAIRIIPRFSIKGGKLAANEHFSSGEKHASLMLQLKALRNLDHPNICREIETFEDENNIYVVMELYTGGEILQRQKATFSEARVAWVIDQVFSAIAHAHEMNIVHQDLRPENILYATADDDSRLVICDWSLATFIDTPEEDARKKIVVTPFSAPELVWSQRTDRGDVWSIGALTYGLLMMQAPFSDKATGDFSWGSTGSQFSQPCLDFVESLLHLDPSARPSAREALLHPWLRNARSAQGQDVVPIMAEAALAMTAFRNRSGLTKAAATFAAAHLTGPKLHELTAAFNALDANRDGVIDRAELEAALRMHQTDDLLNGDHTIEDAVKSDASLAAIFASMDVDGNGRVQYTEFLAAAVASMMENSVQLCWEAFQAFDVDGNNSIDKSELAAVFNTDELGELLCRMQAAGSSSQELQAAFAELGGVPETTDQLMQRVDKNGDNRISFSEFTEALFGKAVNEEDCPPVFG